MRPAKLWQRKGRPGWFATINGKQVCFGLELTEAKRAFHAQKASGKPIERSRALVAQLVELYLEHAATEVAAATYTNYQWYLQQWVNFAGWRVAAQLRPFDLATWTKSKPQWNASTRRAAIKIAQRWSKWCADQGYLDSDPIAGAKAPSGVTRAPSPAGDIERFVTAIQCPLLRNLAIVLLDTGARPKEVSTLTAAQVDWEASTAIVIGKMGPRMISLTDRARAILLGLAKQYPDGPLLRNRNGTPWSRGSMGKRFRTVCRRADVRVVPYAFRHDLWSRATKAGVDGVIVMKQLGHKSMRMLLTTYAHADAEMLKEAVEKASQSNKG